MGSGPVKPYSSVNFSLLMEANVATSVDLDMIQSVGIGDKALGSGKNFRWPTKNLSERPKVFVVVRNESCDRNHQLFLIRSPGNVVPEVRQSLR